ncbi:MAG: zinc ribbon domain-containing protein [Eubacteriales bacterium]|nr:zinc ribbon domain-containing protein [Eubacteriales bacterium]
MEKKKGYSIRTWKYTLLSSENEFFYKTEDYFRDIVGFYFDLLSRREELWNLNMFQIQRGLEILTVAGRDGRVPEVELPYHNVPVYFRRAAIDKAATAAKTCLASYMEEDKANAGKLDLQKVFPQKVDATVTFYKGMYKDLTDKKVTLKLWDGENWVWKKYPLKGRKLPSDGISMSPNLVKYKHFYMLHVPVKLPVDDIRNAKSRMLKGDKICSLQFTNTDVFTVCCVMDNAGKQQAVHFCRGGDMYRYQCNNILKKIQCSEKFTKNDKETQSNKKHYVHLRNLSEYYAHKVSREVIDFCCNNKVKLIILPEYEEEFSSLVQYRCGMYSPIYLSARIRRYLKYKAWVQGILILEVGAQNTSDHCFYCGSDIKKKRDTYFCCNDHRGNRFLNSARNLGQKCIDDFRCKQ